jgi:N-formylglutamate deformylase
MTFSSWAVAAASPVIATAIHAGHGLRPEVAEVMALAADTRLREEDPHTGDLAARVGSHVVVNRSRFEVDLNRDRNESVYVTPRDAWDLDLWNDVVAEDLVDRSRGLHDEFYARLGTVLDGLVDRHGGFVLYDVHSYNHRRGGPDAPPADPRDNPLVNLGTGSLPERWRPVADEFLATLRAERFRGEAIDARENVKFRGRHLAAFVNGRYGAVGCALAIEFKKEYMDEWTGEVDRNAVATLGGALAMTVDRVVKAHARCR